jgi:hypothetical protein
LPLIFVQNISADKLYLEQATFHEISCMAILVLTYVQNRI